MIFRQLFDTETSTYTYLLADNKSKEAIIIDSVKENVERDLHLIQELGLKLIYTIETHRSYYWSWGFEFENRSSESSS